MKHKKQQRKNKKINSSVEKQNKIFSLQGLTMPRSGRYNDNQIYKVTQTYEVSAFHVTSTTLPTFFSFNQVLSVLDNATAFTTIFDEYKFTEIEAWIVPRVSDGTTNGLLHSVIDIDDSTALTTVAQAFDYQNCLVASTCNGHYRVWKPHAALAAYSGAFTSFANKEAPWCDSASPNIQHYGLKTAASATSTVLTFDLIVRVHLAFRAVR